GHVPHAQRPAVRADPEVARTPRHQRHQRHLRPRPAVDVGRVRAAGGAPGLRGGSLAPDPGWRGSPRAFQGTAHIAAKISFKTPYGGGVRGQSACFLGFGAYQGRSRKTSVILAHRPTIKWVDFLRAPKRTL